MASFDDDNDDVFEAEPALNEESSLLLRAKEPNSMKKKAPSSAVTKKLSEEQEMPARRHSRRNMFRTVVQTISIVACSGLVILLLVVTRRTTADDASVTGSFTVSNFYTARDGAFATDYPWADQYQLVEPHIDTTLTLASSVSDALWSGYEVVWEVQTSDSSSGSDSSYAYPTGPSVVASFNSTGFRQVRWWAAKTGRKTTSSSSSSSAAEAAERRRHLLVSGFADTLLSSGGGGSGGGESRMPQGLHAPAFVKRVARAALQAEEPMPSTSSSSAGFASPTPLALVERLSSPLASAVRRRLGWVRGDTALTVDDRLSTTTPKADQSSSLATVLSGETVSVLCLYVRREVRALSDDDRAVFFGACEVVFRVPTEAGQLLYGPKYLGLGNFAMDHNTLAGNADCDHMHDGLGFLTNHGAQTVQFEQALQSVHPRASVPYWDYTIDMTAVEVSGSVRSFFDSAVFGPDFFGSAQTTIRHQHSSSSSSGNDDDNGSGSDDDDDDDGVASGLVDPSGRLLTGRFTQVEVSAAYWGLEDTAPVLNAYGLLRSPWNVNNDRFVNRFNTTYGFQAVGGGLDKDDEVEEQGLVYEENEKNEKEGGEVEVGSSSGSSGRRLKKERTGTQRRRLLQKIAKTREALELLEIERREVEAGALPGEGGDEEEEEEGLQEQDRRGGGGLGKEKRRRKGRGLLATTRPAKPPRTAEQEAKRDDTEQQSLGNKRKPERAARRDENFERVRGTRGRRHGQRRELRSTADDGSLDGGGGVGGVGSLPQPSEPLQVENSALLSPLQGSQGMPRVGDDDGLELQGQGNSRRRLLGDKTASWKKARDRAEADLKAAKDQAVKDVLKQRSWEARGAVQREWAGEKRQKRKAEARERGKRGTGQAQEKGSSSSSFRRELRSFNEEDYQAGHAGGGGSGGGEVEVEEEEVEEEEATLGEEEGNKEGSGGRDSSSGGSGDGGGRSSKKEARAALVEGEAAQAAWKFKHRAHRTLKEDTRRSKKREEKKRTSSRLVEDSKDGGRDSSSHHQPPPHFSLHRRDHSRRELRGLAGGLAGGDVRNGGGGGLVERNEDYSLSPSKEEGELQVVVSLEEEGTRRRGLLELRTGTKKAKKKKKGKEKHKAKEKSKEVGERKQAAAAKNKVVDEEVEQSRQDEEHRRKLRVREEQRYRTLKLAKRKEEARKKGRQGGRRELRGQTEDGGDDDGGDDDDGGGGGGDDGGDEDGGDDNDGGVDGGDDDDRGDAEVEAERIEDREREREPQPGLFARAVRAMAKLATFSPFPSPPSSSSPLPAFLPTTESTYRKRHTRRQQKRKRRLEGAATEFGSADCGTVYAAMQYDSWYLFGKKVEYQPHGPVHTLIGGVAGADYKKFLTDQVDVPDYIIEV